MNQLNIPFYCLNFIKIVHTNPEVLESIIQVLEEIGINCQKNPIDNCIAYIKSSDNGELSESQSKKLSGILCGYPTSIELQMTIGTSNSQHNYSSE